MYNVASDALGYMLVASYRCESSMPTEKELKEIIRTYNGGKWLEYFGPHSIGTAKVWEIWTKIDNTPHTRFWLEDKNGP